ncbi:primosomal protein N, partial [Candidatus Termititenax persephonae]
VAEDVQKIFPSARVLRLDSQTLSTKEAEGHYVEQALREGSADIVIGTQMALRVGLHGSKINLIALLDADMELNTPDFRAGEHFYQLLFNLKGRLARFKNGRLIVQLANPQAFDFKPLLSGDYSAAAAAEAEFRKEFNFPPYNSLVKLVLTSKSKKDLNTFTQIILDAVKTAYSAFMRVEGPVQSGVQADKFSQQYLLVKSLDDAMLQGFLKTLFDNKPPKQVTLKIVADPYNFI